MLFVSGTNAVVSSNVFQGLLSKLLGVISTKCAPPSPYSTLIPFLWRLSTCCFVKKMSARIAKPFKCEKWGRLITPCPSEGSQYSGLELLTVAPPGALLDG